MTSKPPEPLSQLPRDAKCARKVRRAVTVAVLNGWSFAIFAIASALLLLADITLAAVGITVALGIVTYCEFRGQRLLRQLDPSGCKILGWGQLCLLAALAAYCGWSIAWGFLYLSNLSQALAEHPELLENYDEVQRRDVKDIAVAVDEFWPQLVAVVYGAVIIASVIYQGGNAWYYFTRRKFVRECREMLGMEGGD